MDELLNIASFPKQFLIEQWKTAAIGLIVFWIIHFIISVRRLPPGPKPWPILGNLLMFRSEKGPNAIFLDAQKKYGDVYTLWLGSVPFVIVSNLEMFKTALLERKYEFEGRFQVFIMRLIMEGGGSDIAFVDPSLEWEALRKLGHAAIRRYTPTANVALLVHSVVDDVTTEILANAKDHKVNPKDLFYLMIYNITAFSAFKSRYNKNDTDYQNMRTRNDKAREVIATGFIGDFIPILRPFYYKQERQLQKGILELRTYFRKMYDEHQRTYQKGVIRDFTDAVLASKAEAIQENSESAKYMTDQNLNFVIADLFNAGIDTTRSALMWIVLYLTRYPDIQEKVYHEINEKIGERMAVQNDGKQCPFTCAVISEVLRLRAPVPLGLPHKTTCDTELGGHNIPKGTGVLFYHPSVNINEEYWTDAKSFHPERFLDANGQYNTTRILSYTPFGLGRRSCIGEKLARAYLFLILVGLLQKYQIKLADHFKNASLEPKKQPGANEPEDFEVVFTQRV